MTSPLDRLIGMKLVAARADEESVGLEFSACAFSGYTKYSSSSPLEVLVGRTVQDVYCEPESQLSIEFTGGEQFALSLAPSDYTGPEAFCARFADGPWVVQ